MCENPGKRFGQDPDSTSGRRSAETGALHRGLTVLERLIADGWVHDGGYETKTVSPPPEPPPER